MLASPDHADVPHLIALAILTVASVGVLLISGGVSLGLFFGGVGIVVVFGPLAVERGSALRHDALRGATVVAIVAAGWGAAWYQSAVTLGEWAAAGVLLAAVATAALGTTRLLVRCRVGPTYAVALVSAVAVLWLGWPIWLASVLTGPLVDRLTPAHPLFALNGLLPHLGIWTQQPIAYKLMNLNQDVMYALPRSVWPAVALHGGVGAGTLALSTLGSFKSKRMSVPGDAGV